jgi:hypothetical protein
VIRFRHFEAYGAYRIGIDGEDPDGPRVLLVGEDNPYSDDPRQALWPSPSTSAGGRLQSRILGLSHQSYYGLWRTNLCHGEWNSNAARITAQFIVPVGMSSAAYPWLTIVCLGRKVAAAFEDVLDVELKPWTWHPHWARSWDDGAPDLFANIVRIPHPSGRTRDWNDPRSIERARALLTEAAPHVPWGELGRIPSADG